MKVSRSNVFDPRITGKTPRFVGENSPLNQERKTAFTSLQDYVGFIGRSAGLPSNNQLSNIGETTSLLRAQATENTNVAVKIDPSAALQFLNKLEELISIVQTTVNAGGGDIAIGTVPVLSISGGNTDAIGVNAISTQEGLLSAVEKICAHRNAPLKTRKITLSSCFGINYTEMASTIIKTIKDTKKELLKLKKDVTTPKRPTIQRNDITTDFAPQSGISPTLQGVVGTGHDEGGSPEVNLPESAFETSPSGVEGGTSALPVGAADSPTGTASTGRNSNPSIPRQYRTVLRKDTFQAS